VFEPENPIIINSNIASGLTTLLIVVCFGVSYVCISWPVMYAVLFFSLFAVWKWRLRVLQCCNLMCPSSGVRNIVITSSKHMNGQAFKSRKCRILDDTLENNLKLLTWSIWKQWVGSNTFIARLSKIDYPTFKMCYMWYIYKVVSTKVGGKGLNEFLTQFKYQVETGSKNLWRTPDWISIVYH